MSAKAMFIGATFCAACAAAQAMGQEDVRKVQIPPSESKVIDEKCLVCHNRKIIDEAVTQRKDMEKVIHRMEKKGVILTDTERRVMGHFWTQQPFRKENGESLPQEPPRR